MTNPYEAVTGSHADLYSKFRPEPPPAVIERIIGYVKSKIDRPLQNAVDIGCGSGQSTLVLAPYFQQVTGFDISEEQVQQAREGRSAPNVQYRASVAESLDIPDSSVDLVASCEAFHWFDIPKAFVEIERILVPNGVFAAYGYWIPLPTFDSPLKTEKLRELIIDYFYHGKLGKPSGPQRKLVENRYRDIELPFSDCVRDTKIVRKSVCTVSDYIGYLSSWSTYQTLLKEKPDETRSLLEDIREKMMNIIEADSTPGETILNLCTDYFLVMGSKKKAP